LLVGEEEFEQAHGDEGDDDDPHRQLGAGVFVEGVVLARRRAQAGILQSDV